MHNVWNTDNGHKTNIVKKFYNVQNKDHPFYRKANM